MIFVTIGSMLPFERLIRVMDGLAGRWSDEGLFAQIGSGAYLPSHMPFERMLTPAQFKEQVRASRLIVAHAGMGSVITAMEAAKPIVILPRLQASREHTTNHQVDTARWLAAKPGVYVAMTDAELPEAIERALAESAQPLAGMQTTAPEPFVDRIRAFIAGA